MKRFSGSHPAASVNQCASHVTAVILTKNEESNVTDCLKSVEWVSEIIVVDSESTDRTVALARRLTNRVYVVPWRGFGPQKNFGIDQANGPWIFIVDADERVTAGLRDEIQDLLRNGSASHVAGYRVARRNFFYGRWMQHGGMFPDRQLRVFRKDAGRYDDTLLHERLLLKGDVEDLQGFLDHHSVPTIARHVRKMIHYTSLAAREKLKTLRRVTFTHLFGRHLWIIIKVFILRRGWKDGLPGLIAALFAGFHTFVKYAKAYEILETSPSEGNGDRVANRP